MINPVENQNYLRYANIIFSHFEGFKEGEGCFLMRILRSKYRGIGLQEELNMLHKILYNLCVNDFLTPKDEGENWMEGFICVTEKGADFLQGGPLIVNKVDFNQYIVNEDDVRKQFDDLWSLIGKQESAPFYIKGSVFLNMIRPYIKEYIGEYMDYMAERTDKGLSTSRRIWYKELYEKVPNGKRKDFLADLSYAVSLSFYFKDHSDDEFDELFLERLEAIDDEVSTVIPELPELNIHPENKRQTPEELLAICLEICNAYKALIENNRMYKLLYNDDKSPKNETAAQLLFFSVAQGYCKQYDIDINRESDPGIGQLDFKLSVGNKSKVIIEMKLSSNSTLYHGYDKQLPAYLRAEETKYGIFLVLQMNTTPEPQLLQTQQAYEKVKDNPDNTIKLVCIDATPKASASKI